VERVLLRDCCGRARTQRGAAAAVDSRAGRFPEV
jgi:hypothetical protein